MSDKFNIDKFTTKPGEVKTSLSQCVECIFSTDYKNCELYGDKPLEYATNEEECPRKTTSL